jgi:hypothetical protein
MLGVVRTRNVRLIHVRLWQARLGQVVSSLVKLCQFIPG